MKFPADKTEKNLDDGDGSSPVPRLPSTRKKFSIVLRVILHVLVLLFVVLVPVLVYEWVMGQQSEGHRNVGRFAFAGCVTYPIYLLYWATKIRSTYLRYIVAHTIWMLTLTMGAMGLFIPSLQWLALALPFTCSAACLPASAVARFLGKRQHCKAWLTTFAVSLPLAAALTVMVGYGAGLSAMSGMRY